jgi:hypothetical protein
VDKSHPHALYRYIGSDATLLYAGKTNPIRRVDEHQRTKPWITETAWIEVEWWPTADVGAAEVRAIQDEHPRYNVHHNRGHIKVEAEFSAPSGSSMALLGVCTFLTAIASKWAFDSIANRSVKRRAERMGVSVELPPVRNPFTPSSRSISYLSVFDWSVYGKDRRNRNGDTHG